MDFIQTLIEEVNNPANKTSIFTPVFSMDLLNLRCMAAKMNERMNVIEVIEPINKDQEKAKWLQAAKDGKFTNPNLQYNQDKLREIASFATEISELRAKTVSTDAFYLRDSFEKKMLLKVLDDMFLTARIAKSILEGEDELTKMYVSKKYDFSLLSYDKNADLSSEAVPEKPKNFSSQKSTYGAEDIASAFQFAQELYGFKWPIVVSDTAVAIDVRDKSNDGQCIVVPSSRKTNADKLLRLIGHEIESHIRSSMNGAELFGYGGLGLKTDNEVLYEGLAMLSDCDFDLWSKGCYAGPLIWYLEAIEFALAKHSFAETAEIIFRKRDANHEKNALEKAFNTTLRVYRGITNCENPSGYAFMKDAGYFIGYSVAKQLRELEYGWLLELGSFDPSQLLLIAKTFRLSPSVTKYQRIDLKKNSNFLTRI